MKAIKRRLVAVDQWQQRHRPFAIAYAVIRKFGDDDANLLVVALGWYGFTAIYPLLLVVVTIFGYIGVASLGLAKKFEFAAPYGRGSSFR